MSLRYAYSLHEQAVRELVAAEDDERREVINLCESLARSPGLQATEYVLDSTGRRNEVVYSRRFRILYWVDHASADVRIVDVRRY